MASSAVHIDSHEVYFEAQDPESALCGRHAINNLLQGAYFTSIDLGNIGAQLDEQEQKLMSSAPSSNSSPVRNGGSSNGTDDNPYSNVSLDGYFSVEVLFSALRQLNIDALPLSHPECTAANENPTKEEGFIFYQMAHWIAYRRIHGVWYDLNSQSNFLMLDPQPVRVSDFFLSAQMSKLQDDGFTVYVIRGLHCHSLGRLAPKANELKGEYQWYQSADIVSHVELDKQSRAKQAEDRRIKTQNLQRYDPQQYAALMRHERGGNALNIGHDTNTNNMDPEAFSLWQQQQQYLAMQQIEANRNMSNDAGPGIMSKMANPLSKLKTFYNDTTTGIKRKLNTKPPLQPPTYPSPDGFARDLERAKRESLAMASRPLPKPRNPNHIGIEKVSSPHSTQSAAAKGRTVQDDDVELALAISASIADNNGVIASSPKTPKQQHFRQRSADKASLKMDDFLNLDSMPNDGGTISMQFDDEKKAEVVIDDNDPFALLIKQYSSGNVESVETVTNIDVNINAVHNGYDQMDANDHKEALFDPMNGLNANVILDHFTMNQELNPSSSSPFTMNDVSGASGDSMGSTGRSSFLNTLQEMQADTESNSPLRPQQQSEHVDQLNRQKSQSRGRDAVKQMEDDLWRMLEQSLTAQ